MQSKFVASLGGTIYRREKNSHFLETYAQLN